MNALMEELERQTRNPPGAPRDRKAFSGLVAQKKRQALKAEYGYFSDHLPVFLDIG